MKRLFCALAALCLLLVSADAALPETGSYSGMLIMTKQILGAPVKFNVRAMAEVSQDGTLKIVLLTTPSPLPNAQDDIALETKIQTNGACEIPRASNPAAPASPASPGAAAGGGIPPTLTINLGSPVYFGLVQSASGMFTLSYDNVPAYYLQSDGTIFRPEHFAMPRPSAVYKFSFRKVTPGSRGNGL